MKLAVLVVGYKSKSYLEECFGSLVKSTHKPWRTYFVDNNSEDGSLELVGAKFPEITIIANEQNLGFAGANNLGIKQAIKDGADYVFLMNPDTILDRHCLERLVTRADPETILQPLILLADKKTLINTTGGVLSYLGFSYCSDYKVPAKEITEEREVAIASGAACLIPIYILATIGLLEEAFFLYHEDVDLAWRARLYGFHIVLIPHAHIWHHYGFSRNMGKMRWAERNRLLFLLRTFEWKTLLLLIPIGLLTELALLFYSLISGWLGYKLASYAGFFALLPATLRTRRKIQKERTVSDHDLIDFMASEIGFSEVKVPALVLYNKIMTGYWWLVCRFI